MVADGLRLTLEIVPMHIADRGLSGTLPKARWDGIRRGVAEAHGYRCAACGFGGRRESPLQCHEVWEYDLDTVRPPTPEEVVARKAGGKIRWSRGKARESVRRGVRRLVDLLPLCGPCHRAKHSDWPCYMFRPVREYLAAQGRDPKPGELLRETLLILDPCVGDSESDERLLLMARAGFGLLAGNASFRSRDRFMEVNRDVPLAVLEAHCLEACALRDSRRDVEWASDYNGFDRLGEDPEQEPQA